MAPLVPALPRSDSKARLLRHLGLDMKDVMHRRVYNLMKLEASEGRRRIIEKLNSQVGRTGQLHSTGTAAYSTSQIDETTMDAEVHRIYELAQPVTKPLYALGQDTENPARPNWIIRWMLWHVFRYRDGRQKNNAPSQDAASSAGEEDVADISRPGSGSVDVAVTAPEQHEQNASSAFFLLRRLICNDRFCLCNTLLTHRQSSQAALDSTSILSEVNGPIDSPSRDAGSDAYRNRSDHQILIPVREDYCSTRTSVSLAESSPTRLCRLALRFVTGCDPPGLQEEGKLCNTYHKSSVTNIAALARQGRVTSSSVRDNASRLTMLFRSAVAAAPCSQSHVNWVPCWYPAATKLWSLLD